MTIEQKAQNKYEAMFVLCILFSFFIHFFALFCLSKHFLSFTYTRGYLSPIEKKASVKISKVTERDVLPFAIDKRHPETTAPKVKEKRSLMAELNVEKKLKFSSNLVKKEKIDSKFVLEKPESSLKKQLILLQPKKIETNYTFQKIDSSKKIIQSLKSSIMEIKQKEPKAIFAKSKLSWQKEFSSRDFVSLETLSATANLKKIARNINTYEKDLEFQSKWKTSFLKQLKIITLVEKEPIKTPFLPFLPRIPSLNDLGTVKCSDDFDVELEYVARDDAPGYIIAITLIAKPTCNLNKIKQNFYFLLDRSNSIQNKRFLMTRAAIASSVLTLNKQDTFNIFSFDSKIDFLFAQNKNPSREAFLEARNFLKSQSLGNFFSSKSFFLPLNKMLNNHVNKNEINNIIFISDGDELDKPKNFQLLHKWTEINKGVQSFHALTLSSDKNIPVLDYFTSQNKGKLISSTTVKGIRRHLVKLIKSLSSPIAKNVSVNVYDQEINNLSLHPNEVKNHLYLDSPYVVITSVEKLGDFMVFIQGKNPDMWFNIKKEISFLKAKEGGSSLKKKWATCRANELYTSYLSDGNVSHLKKALDILQPFDLTPAFR
jgi:hypothetical protein